MMQEHLFMQWMDNRGYSTVHKRVKPIGLSCIHQNDTSLDFKIPRALFNYPPLSFILLVKFNYLFERLDLFFS